MTASGTAEAPVIARLFGPRPGLGAVIWTVFAASTIALLLLADRHSLPHPSAWVIAAGLLIAAAATFFSGGHPLGIRPAWIAAGLAGLASIAPFWRASEEASGYAPWYVRTATILFAALIVRGRPLQAWLGAGLSYLLLIGWGLSAEEPFGAWGGVIFRQVATVIAIQVFALLMVRLSRATAAYRAEERNRIQATEHRAAGVRERRSELAAIRALVDPTLQLISTVEASRDLRDRADLLAAELRDRLRGRRLATAKVSDAAREARRRGVDVVLLDDFEGRDDPAAGVDEVALAAGLDWVATRLAATPGPRVTVRLSRDSDGRPVLSMVSGEDSSVMEKRLV